MSLHLRLTSAAAACAAALLVAPAAMAAEGHIELKHREWPTSTASSAASTGRPPSAASRSTARSAPPATALKYVAFRNLATLGYSEDEIKAIAAEYTITDGPNDEGEMFERPGQPFDRFPSPFPTSRPPRPPPMAARRRPTCR